MEKDCITCDLNQINKIVNVLKLDKETESQLQKITKNYLDICDKTKTNPEIMGEIWMRITPILTEDPYEKIKSYYNQLLMNI